MKGENVRKPFRKPQWVNKLWTWTLKLSTCCVSSPLPVPGDRARVILQRNHEVWTVLGTQVCKTTHVLGTWTRVRRKEFLKLYSGWWIKTTLYQVQVQTSCWPPNLLQISIMGERNVFVLLPFYSHLFLNISVFCLTWKPIGLEISWSSLSVCFSVCQPLCTLLGFKCIHPILIFPLFIW